MKFYSNVNVACNCLKQGHKIWELTAYFSDVNMKFKNMLTHICTSSSLSNWTESSHFWIQDKCMGMVNTFLFEDNNNAI